MMPLLIILLLSIHFGCRLSFERTLRHGYPQQLTLPYGAKSKRSKPASSSLAPQPFSSSSSSSSSSTVPSSSDELAAQIKCLRKISATKKITNLMNQSFIESGSNVMNEKIFLLGFRSLWQVNRTDLCIDIYPLYQNILCSIRDNWNTEHQFDYSVAASLLRSYSSLGRIDIAENIANNMGTYVLCMYACILIY